MRCVYLAVVAAHPPRQLNSYLLCCFCEYTSKYLTRKSWLFVTTKYFCGTSPPSLFFTLALFLSISSESELGREKKKKGELQVTAKKVNNQRPHTHPPEEWEWDNQRSSLGIPLNPSASKNRLRSLLEAIPLLVILGMDDIMAQTRVTRRWVSHPVLEKPLILTVKEKQHEGQT